MGKGGGGQPTQTTSNVTNTNVPEYARPYVENMLGATQQQLFKMDGSNVTGFQPYKAYGGTYDDSGNLTGYDPSKAIAGFSPLQEQAQRGIAGIQVPGEFGAAAGFTQQATQRALGSNYAPSNYGSQFNPQGIGYGAQNAQAASLGYAPQVSAGQYNAPMMNTAQTGYDPRLQNFQMGPAERVGPQSVYAQGINAAQMGPAQNVGAQNVSARNINAAQMGPAQNVSAQNISARDINAAQMGPAERVSTQSFAQPGSADAYMSPYMQSVVDIQKREARRQSDIQGTQQQAQAVGAGAFGGSRDAIMRAERERNLSQQMGDIQAQGSQAAYQQAQQQFNAEQQARLQAQQANQAAGLTVGGQNLTAQQQSAVQNAANQLQASGMNAQQAMQAALANQQAGLTVGGQNLNAQQQAEVQNAANQLQAGGMNAQQAMQAALANQQAGLTVGTQNLSAQQQANVQNAANQLQAGGMNAQQAMQAALANQQAGLTVGQQNLGASLGIQQLGAQTGLQTSLANLSSAQQANVQNQAAQLQTQGMNAQQALQAALANQQTISQYGLQQGQLSQQANLANQAAQNQAGQFNAGQNLQAASLAAQYGQSANQLNEQSRQYGAGYGMQGLQTGLQSANQLANIGNQGLQAQQGIYGLQNQVGQQQQLNQQQVINQAMQDYANAQQYPLMQLGTMSNMLRGLPMQAQTTQQYQAQANPITQGIGAIGALGSLAQMKAKGGAVKSMASGGITSIPRYDVGGEVMSQLATMPDEALKKEAMESPSPKVREMAVAILKQRQAGMDARPQMAAAPEGVGPMGVDYNAGYAGGGIIAFAKGREIPFIASANDADAGEADAKKAMASGIVPTAVPTAVSVPVNDATAGEAEAKQAMARGVVPPPASAGILAAPPVETDPGRAAIADLKKTIEPFAAIATKTTRQLYEEDLADRKALGLDNSEAKQKLMQQQMAERANLTAENERTNLLRRAKFFAELGSTPGNTLVAGLVALKNQIPDILQDAKDQKLARQQADKAIFDLEESMRLEKLGVYDKSDARKQAAIKTMADLQSNLTTASVQQASAEKRLQGDLAQSSATVTAGAARNATDITQAEIAERSALATTKIKDATDRLKIQEDARARAATSSVAADDKFFRAYDAASNHLRQSIQGAETLRSGKDYQTALADVTLVEGMTNAADGKRDPAKWAALAPYLKEKHARALQTIERIDTNITTTIDTSKAVADAAFRRLNIAPSTGQNFPAPPAEAISTLKNGNTPQARAQFDQIFGPGAAAKALGR